VKILHISDVYFPRVNGVSTSIYTFRRELRRLGHEVELIAPDYGQTTPDEQAIRRIPSRRVILDPEDRMMRLGALRRLEPDLAARPPDLVHVHTPFVAHHVGRRLAQRLNVPCVETYHTFFEEYLGHYLPILPNRITRWIARHFARHQGNGVDALIVPSSPMAEILEEYGVDTPLVVLPTGIELERFASCDGTAFRQRYGIPLDRPMLTFIGRLAFEKNVDFIIHALTRIRHQRPDVLLVIVGEGPAERHIRQLVTRLGLEDNVAFLGYLDRETTLKDCYCAADAFVFASRTETQGLVLLEAMALGLPIVSTAVMGTMDILSPERGALIAEESLDDFAQKVLRVLGDEALRLRLRTEARQEIQRWSASRTAEQLAELYRELLGRQATRDAA